MAGFSGVETMGEEDELLWMSYPGGTGQSYVCRIRLEVGQSRLGKSAVHHRLRLPLHVAQTGN